MQGSSVLVVVDDNDMSCWVTARMLTAAGFLVFTAASADEALRIVANEAEVELVVADVCMPGMNGLELAKQLRQSHPALPVLFMAGAISGKLVPALSGPFLQKPFSEADLLEEVRRTAELFGDTLD
jgi:two-component system cell cycle sensor histidine kinase/response regulator CckA